MSGNGDELDGALYDELKYRAASPISHLACLDVITKVQRTWDDLESVDEMFLYLVGWRSGLTRLVPRGSMTNEVLMAERSRWRRGAGDPAGDHLQLVQSGLENIGNALIRSTPAEERVFMKMPVCDEKDLTYVSANKPSAWLDGIGGLELGHGLRLSASVDTLTAAHVDIAQLTDWLEEGYWVPKNSLLKSCPTEWSDQYKCHVKKLRIVCEVLYGKKIVHKRETGQFGNVGFQGLRGVSGGVEPRRIRGGRGLELKGDQLIIGYRYVLAEFDLNGVFLGAIPSDTGIRAGDDLRERNALAMGKDDFSEADEHGNKVRIPLLTPTKEELERLEELIANSLVEGSVSA